MKKWRCSRCKYVHEGQTPPEICPVCGAPKSIFVLLDESGIEARASVIESRKADVIVVGSGASAFAAAVTAKSKGASVIMLEKADEIGGTSARSGGGYWVPANRWQKEAGYEDSPEKAIPYMARYSYPHLFDPDAKRYGIPKREYELLEAYAENARNMAVYFDELGALEAAVEINWTGKPQVDYMDHLPENGSARGRSIYPKNEEGAIGYGDELIGQMEAWCKGNGVEIVTGSEVFEIMRNGGGIVSGVKAKEGEEIVTYHAGAGVIFGSGGYSHNPEYMLQFQRGPHFGGCSVPTNTGDFIRMAGAVGAQMGNTAGAFRAQSMIEMALQYPGGSSNVFYLIGDSNLMVNKYGKRIMNEKRNYTDRAMLHFVWDPCKAEWTNMLTFWIIDRRSLTLWQGFPPYPVGTDEMPYLIKGATLDELSRKIGERVEALAPHIGRFSLDPSFPEALGETVERYNAFARKGKDDDFGRGDYTYDREWTTFPPTIPVDKWPLEGYPNYTMHPLSDEGPYYAIILAAGTLDTNGGPVIDKYGRVLDWDNHPIEGLYGAGNCIASPTANAYWGAGSTIGPGMTFGYLAALHATDTL